MKAVLALAGVGVFGAAVYFIAKRRNVIPTVNNTQPSGSISRPKQSTSSMAASLITSENIATVGGLLKGIFGSSGGGAVVPASPGGVNASGWESL